MSRNLPEVEAAERRRVGATLRALRQRRGFTADQFACELGKSRPYLANIEAGRKPLPEVLLARAADLLDVPQVAIVREGYYDEGRAA